MNFFSWFLSSTPKITIKSVENVCFKGGGMKGNAFIGVDRAFTELGLWSQIKRFIGSSAGAIFAGTAACRIPCEKLEEIIKKTDYTKFKDDEWGIAGDGYRLIEYMGLYKGDYFYEWYGNLLEECIDDRYITLQGIYDRFGTELVITTTDLTEQCVVYMNRHNNPDLQLRDAVRRSMSIPVFYTPIIETDDKDVKHVYVDGGCTNNYPLNYFDKLYPSQTAFEKTIGFDLESDQEPVIVTGLISLVTSLINTTIKVIEKSRFTEEDKYRSIFINTTGFTATDFDITEQDIDRLINKGYNQTMKFFKALEPNDN